MTITERKVCDGCGKTITKQDDHQAIIISIEALGSDSDDDVCVDLDFHRKCQSKIQLVINERLK